MKPALVAGRIPVLECLRAGKRPARRLFLLEGGKDLGAIRHAARLIPVQTCNRQQLDRMTNGATHQGVVLEADPLPLHDLKDWLPHAPADALLVLLDRIEDPHNLGAIARSAAACGATALVFGRDHAAPLSLAAVKAAAGALEYLDLVQVSSLIRAVEALQGAGFRVIGLDADAEADLWAVSLGGRAAILIGSEGEGIRPLLRQRCDTLARIPIRGPITSLNASVSAGIALAEALRQRR
jgi:23S rRNA (guanosine2251-2'-O)-methyltransferase